MPELTDRALRRLANGAVNGAGTGVCRECGGDKERARLNSDRCRRCAGGRKKDPLDEIRARLTEIETVLGIAPKGD